MNLTLSGSSPSAEIILGHRCYYGGSGNVPFYYKVAVYRWPSWNPPVITLSKVDNFVTTTLAQWTVGGYTSGMTFAASMRTSETNGQSKGITVHWGSESYYHRITDFMTLGSPGLIFYSNASWAGANQIEYTAPNAVSAASISTSYSGGQLSVQWTGVSDNTNGIGRVRCAVYKGSTLLGETAGTSWTMAAGPGEQFDVGIAALDGHRNFAATSTKNVIIAPGQTGIWDDSRRIGIHGLATHWGGLGEQIDVRSMNLNFSLPLLAAQGRGVGVPLGISYNSQNWRYDGAVWQPGGDVGYGFGWRLMAGAVSPIWATPTQFSYYQFTDATGAEYKLDVQNGNVWSSKQSVYVWYDAGLQRLFFKDGSYWQLDAVSGASESDAGSRYPTRVYDRHGNYVRIVYKPQVGGSFANTSARIDYIEDVRAKSQDSFRTYNFTYNTDAIPHLTGIANTIGTAEQYSFSYSGATTLLEPFGNGNRGSFVKLNTLTRTGVNLAHQFEYNSYGEMTKTIYPYGGELRWSYATRSYTGGKQIREVSNREFVKSAGAGATNYAFSHPGGDSGLKMHSQTTLADPGGVGKRLWSFATTNDFKIGLETVYEEQHNNATKFKREATWAQQATSNNAYIGETLTTIDQGQSYQKQSKTTQTIDQYGNVLTAVLYGYGSLSTPLRSTTCNYTGYGSRYIYNMLSSCSTTENGVTLNSPGVTYDQFGSGMANMPFDTRLWEDPGTNQRGLITSINDGYTSRGATFNKAGQSVSSSDGQGFSQTITYGGQGGSMVPTQMTPNGNSALGTTMNWNGFLGITSVSSGSGTTQSYSYDSYARPQTTTSKDGATTSYSFSVSPAWTMATVNGSRWTKTWFDGVGRPIKVETGDGGGTKIVTETEYDSCACSPMGKVKRTSLPYAPGGTVYWTTNTYDGLGPLVSG
jgi:YD repeat-containing protein